MFFGTQLDRRPYCCFSKADAGGNITSTVPIDLPAPTMMHDFAVTEQYALFMDSNLVIDPSVGLAASPLLQHLCCKLAHTLWC